ncbi:hypothetical protein J6590_046007, partial [Homalodisca vitripennis]
EQDGTMGTTDRRRRQVDACRLLHLTLAHVCPSKQSASRTFRDIQRWKGARSGLPIKLLSWWSLLASTSLRTSKLKYVWTKRNLDKSSSQQLLFLTLNLPEAQFLGHLRSAKTTQDRPFDLQEFPTAPHHVSRK